MSVEFNYTREWTDAEAFPLLSFKRNWENPEDYPTIETDEQKVRQDMQSLHDEVKDFLNTELIPRVVAEDATVEAWQAQEEAHAQAEVGRADAEANRVSAETARSNAEQERKNAEASRASAELGRSGAEQIRMTSEENRVAAEENRVAAESARVEAENARVEAEQKREDLETGYVAQAKADADRAEAARESIVLDETKLTKSVNLSRTWADNAKSWAEGGMVAEVEETEDGEIQYFYEEVTGAQEHAEKAATYVNGGTFYVSGSRVPETGAKNYADKAQAYAESGSYTEFVTQYNGDVAPVTKTVEKGAKQYAEEAERLALAASKSSRDATSSKVAAAESATAAATSATAAATSATAASGVASEAAQQATRQVESLLNGKVVAAETAATTATNEANRAKAEADRASSIVGGDYVTRAEATSIANTAEGNANEYTDQKIAEIPAPEESVLVIPISSTSYNTELGLTIGELEDAIAAGKTIILDNGLSGYYLYAGQSVAGHTFSQVPIAGQTGGYATTRCYTFYVTASTPHGRDKQACIKSSYSSEPVAKTGGKMTGLLTLSGDPTDALHAATKQYVDALAGGAAKIATGSYVGNGKNGFNNSHNNFRNTLTFPFEPKIVVISCESSIQAQILVQGQTKSGNVYSPPNSNGVNTVTWNGNSVTWYNENYADSQFNTLNTTYLYVVFG